MKRICVVNKFKLVNRAAAFNNFNRLQQRRRERASYTILKRGEANVFIFRAPLFRRAGALPTGGVVLLLFARAIGDWQADLH